MSVFFAQQYNETERNLLLLNEERDALVQGAPASYIVLFPWVTEVSEYVPVSDSCVVNLSLRSAPISSLLALFLPFTGLRRHRRLYCVKIWRSRADPLCGDHVPHWDSHGNFGELGRKHRHVDDIDLAVEPN
jgi:hypothetical protein